MMDYREIHTKKRILVFCNLEELHMEATESKTIEEAEEKSKISKDDFICHCPFCKKEGHTKHKLYIKTDYSIGRCWVCDRVFRNVSDNIEINFSVPTFNIGCFNNFSLEMPEITDPDLTLDCFRDEFSDYSEDGVNYLINRNIFLKDLYKLIGIKFDELGNPVIPFKFHNDIIYYQIRNRRATKENGKWRYMFPEVKHGQKPPFIIEHGDNKQIILCEGVFDAMALLVQAPDYTPIALGGHSASEYQINFIRDYLPKKILIYMDETKMSYDVLRQVVQYIDYCPIEIIPSNGPDPEENMNSLLKRGVTTFNELAWIK